MSAIVQSLLYSNAIQQKSDDDKDDFPAGKGQDLSYMKELSFIAAASCFFLALDTARTLHWEHLDKTESV